MSHTADLRAEYRQALLALEHQLHSQHVAELLQGLDALLDATRRECFANSPITVWLMGSPSHRFLLAEYDEESKRIRVNLDDVDDEEDEPVATGTGESVEEAVSAALNALQAKEH